MKYIAYYRVSTSKQGKSGLGLKAQREAVKRFISPDDIFKEYEEIETGTNKKHRPILNEAINECKKHNATLIIAKLDRLARNVNFISSLMDSKVKFKAVDMPDANELTIHIMSAIAQNEAKVISKRIKEALKQSNKQLGNPQNLTEKGRKKGLLAIAYKHRNNPNIVQSLNFLYEFSQNPNNNFHKMKLREIADVLNSKGFRTAQGKEFSTTQVIRLKKRLETI